MSVSTQVTLLDSVRRTPTGDSWRQFARIYERLISTWLQRQGVNREDAEDVRQEVMTAVYQQIASFEHNGRPGAFRKWLRGITSNRLRRLWKMKRLRGVEISGVDLAEMADQLADDKSHLSLIWEAQHDQFVLNRLLCRISDRFNEKTLAAFRRIVLLEEPAPQVAQDLEMTLGAVRAAQHRVLNALKEFGQGLID